MWVHLYGVIFFYNQSDVNSIIAGAVRRVGNPESNIVLAVPFPIILAASPPEEDVIAVLLGHERYALIVSHTGHHHSAIIYQLEDIGSGGYVPFAAEPDCGGIIKWQEHLQSIVLIISLEIAIFAVIQQIVFLGVVKGVGLWRCLTPRETVTTTA